MEKQNENVGLAQAQGPNIAGPGPVPETKIEEPGPEPIKEGPETKIEEPEPKEEKPKKEKTPSKLINQGQYGCIYKPQFGCEDDDEHEDDDNNYVSKIQEKTEELEKEINTGKIIQSIDNYFFYYAPIIKSCDVNISNININILRDCAVALNENREINTFKKYASNKIRYVSKYTISDYIKQLSTKENFKKIANIHLYLLEYSIPKLLEKNIVHLDLKTNNIMWDEKQAIPIIIDFGLSINMGEVLNTLPEEKKAIYKKYFIGEEYYIFWCVDIFMISQITQLYNNQENVQEHVLEIILNQIIQNNHFKRLFTTNERNEYIKKYNEYFKKYINSPWTNVITDLLQEKIYSTWDSHSLCSAILFDIVINKSFISNNDTKKEAYMKLLKEVVLSMPDERIGIEDTKKRLYEIMLMTEEKIETPPIPMPRQSQSFFM